jgi:hypothetical protein
MLAIAIALPDLITLDESVAPYSPILEKGKNLNLNYRRKKIVQPIVAGHNSQPQIYNSKRAYALLRRQRQFIVFIFSNCRSQIIITHRNPVKQ